MNGYENSKIPHLFELMTERRVKAKDISEATGIAAGSIADWKAGRSTPTGDRLIALANFFDVSVEYLVGSDNDSNYIDILFKEKIKGLSEEQKKDVVKYIEFLKQKG